MLKYADIYTNIASLGKVFTCIIKSFNMGYETLMMMLFDSEKPTMLFRQCQPQKTSTGKFTGCLEILFRL